MENLISFFRRYNVYHFGIFAFTVIVMIFIFRGKQAKSDLKKNGIIVNARIVDYIAPAKGMTMANYSCEFYYKGKVKNLISESRIQYRMRSYERQYFPALYSERTNTVRLLMKQEDFEEFNLDMPDSLIDRVVDFK